MSRNSPRFDTSAMLFDLLVDLARRHPEQHRARPDVLPSVGFHLEAGDELEHRADVALDRHTPPLRRVDAGDHLEQRALPRAVVPDEAHALARPDRQRDVLQRLHGPADAPVAPDVPHGRLERLVAFGADPKLEIDVFEVNGGHDRSTARTRCAADRSR